MDLCWQSNVSSFYMLSRLVITFLPRSRCLFISWLQSPSAVILELRKIKSHTISTVSPSICHEVMGPDAMILVFWILSFKPIFSLSYFTFIKRLFSSSSLSAIRVLSSAYLRTNPAAAATVKSLQSCPTLCDPIDSSPPGSSVPGIPQAKILEWVAISFSNAWKWKVKVKSLSRVS